MDQLTAHLDRGWDLAANGDARGAEAAARLALEIDPNAPEVHNLLGYVAALSGEAEEAVEHYRNALALDEGYFDAMLNAAEVLVHPLAQFDEAVSMCDEALTWAETDEEIADAILIKVEALLGCGDDESARRALGMVPAGPFEHERYDFLIGRAYFDVGMIDHAAELIERTITRDDQHAEAHYYRGMIRDARGDIVGATSSFLRVRVLDAQPPEPPWTLAPPAFERVVTQSISSLTPALRRFVDGAEVFVTPLPETEAKAAERVVVTRVMLLPR